MTVADDLLNSVGARRFSTLHSQAIATPTG